MKKNYRFAIVSMMFLGMFCAAPFVSALDLSTFSGGEGISTDTVQARAARYTTFLGQPYGETVGFVTDAVTGDLLLGNSQGLYDYSTFRGNGSPYWNLNDGRTAANNCNTFDNAYNIDTYFSGTDEYPEDFVGYKFKLEATLESINYVNCVFRDGGVFADTPRVEILTGGTVKSGGTWSEVAVTWDTAYNNTYRAFHYDENDIRVYDEPSDRVYNITLNTPATNVMGVRLIGTALAEDLNGLFSPDDSGFIGTYELQVNGTLPVMDDIDFTNNLALNQTPIMTITGTGETTQYDQIEVITDGSWLWKVYKPDGTADHIGWDVTYGYDLPDGGEEYVGVMFNEAQSNVTAIGAGLLMFGDGGYLTPDTMRVEYTTDAGATWTTATGLDLGRYEEDFTDLESLTWTYVHSELFTFDTITAAIDGIRLIGSPQEYATSGDNDGFLGCLEFEVFASADLPKIPGDANGDGMVDGSDVTILANNWQAGVPGGDSNVTWEMGDFNGDHMVDGSDVTILANNWQYGVTTAAAAVPEPGMLALLLALGLACLPRWIRR